MNNLESELSAELRLLAEVMHLWFDGYICKSPDSAAPESVSRAKFEEIERLLWGNGISVDYCGWHVNNKLPPAATPEPNCDECGLPESTHPGRICDVFIPEPPSEASPQEDEFLHEEDCPCFSEQHSKDCRNCECQSAPSEASVEGEIEQWEKCPVKCMLQADADSWIAATRKSDYQRGIADGRRDVIEEIAVFMEKSGKQSAGFFAQMIRALKEKV